MRLNNKRLAVLSILIAAVLLLLACPVPENNVVREPVSGLEILKNRVSLDLSDNGKPFIEIMEEKSVILTAKLEPIDVRGGVYWQSARDIVELSHLFGPETTLFARYGGDTTINIRAENAYNEVPVHGQVRVTVVHTSYFKWDYLLDGWNDLPALRSVTIGNGVSTFNIPGGTANNTITLLSRSGNTAIMEDSQRKGFILESPGVLIIGSAMSSATNSIYIEEPLFDENALFNFTVAPSRRPELYSGKIRISVDYEILSEPSFRQGMRIQINNNTIERDNASALNNWLIAEYTAEHPRSGTLTGIFDVNTSDFAQGLDQEKMERIAVMANPPQGMDGQLATVLSRSFVCLALPDGKVLIRNIRIESEN